MYKSSRDLIICQQIMFSSKWRKEDEAKSRMPRGTADKVQVSDCGFDENSNSIM